MPLTWKKQSEPAEYAKHAKAEQVGEENRFTQRVNDLVSLTPFPLAYLAYFAV